MEHDFLEIIKTRRSCRKFQDRQISRVELDAVLEAGTYANQILFTMLPLMYWFLLPQMLILLSRMELVCLKI